MPTYQYRCTDCGTDLEVVQKFTDPSLTDCESCGGNLRKVYNAVGVVFKGSGFYATDNRKSGKSGKGSSEKKSDSSTSSSSSKESSSSSSTSSSSGGSSSGSSGSSSSGSSS